MGDGLQGCSEHQQPVGGAVELRQRQDVSLPFAQDLPQSSPSVVVDSWWVALTNKQQQKGRGGGGRRENILLTLKKFLLCLEEVLKMQSNVIYIFEWQWSNVNNIFYGIQAQCEQGTVLHNIFKATWSVWALPMNASSTASKWHGALSLRSPSITASSVGYVSQACLINLVPS